MKRLRRFLVTNKSDIIYAKIEIGHFFSDSHEREIYLFAVMELGSNILKHAQSNGELWLLEKGGFLALAACDRGIGIGNTELALQKGYSTFTESSLGIGLSSLNSTDGYQLEIVSLNKKSLHGTVVYFGRITADEQVDWLSIPFDENYNGDFSLQKGRLIAFGDVSGHGLKAAAAAMVIMDFFKRHCHSMLTIDDFFKSLHRYLLEQNARSCDLIVGAVEPDELLFAGLGNMTLWEPSENSYISHSLHAGSLGTHYSRSTHGRFELSASGPLLITSDGVLKGCFENLSATIFGSQTNAAMCAVLYFCGSLSDDASIIYIKKKEIA
ncbi:MAG: SpoIIE family protein phosphatase [Sulfuricurvum sp.]|uniref:SpoIIE family protein phosphatase n=1 Tax=Sulfuricurvum sp. TaxID=2025608 RepID=UPI0025FB2E8E|nr:SpoIIE family protein phosphatase [Sulfuricurvum sp.]MCK9372117.1 SpoIIE family protein phosphatase [Sulfuricurvum sp.]